MKIIPFPGFRLAGALTALGLVSASAQIIEFRATINAAQETTASASPANGSAVLLYDVGTNTFDLTVSVHDLANPITASHLHEGAAGVGGGVVTGLGAEAVYTRSGNNVSATFRNVTHGGTVATLLSNGVYYNLHSAEYPAGEVRGQLIARPVRLVAMLDGPQEGVTNTSAAYGAAIITFDPGTKKIWTRLNIYNFTNTLTNSHYHEGAPGVAGPVVHGLGGTAVYTKNESFYGATFSDQTYGGDTVKLLQGDAYLNVHSNVYPPGEIRGQVRVSERVEVARLINVSARSWVGTGDQVLISGFAVTGNEPVAVLLTAVGPSLTAQGVQGALADPMLALHDEEQRLILVNDNSADTFSAADLAGIPFAPTNASESSLIVVLPPGLYTGVVSGAGNTTGVALAEAYELEW